MNKALPQGFVLGTVPFNILINYLVEEGEPKVEKFLADIYKG